MTSQSNQSYLEELHQAILQHNDSRVILLKRKDVLQWIHHDTSFLPVPPELFSKPKYHIQKQCKILEDEWGLKLLSFLREIIKEKNKESQRNWTTKIGETIAKEIQILLGKSVSHPKPIQTWEPDLETEDYVIEVKSQTYFTTGTAGEKILGVPFKYAEIPALFGKPLRIICLAYAEQVCIESYGIFPGDKQTETRKKIIDFYETLNIRFIKTTELLKLFLLHFTPPHSSILPPPSVPAQVDSNISTTLESLSPDSCNESPVLHSQLQTENL